MGVRVLVQAEPFDLAREVAALQQGRTDIGAVVAFTGYCRDEAGMLEALELEHFSGMAEGEIERAAVAAERRFALLGLTVIHRFGRMIPGDAMVLVASAAAHRANAFDAASFVMDYLKTDAPFWKREHRRDRMGDPSDPTAWVAAKPSDRSRKDRWAEADSSTPA